MVQLSCLYVCVLEYTMYTTAVHSVYLCVHTHTAVDMCVHMCTLVQLCVSHRHSPPDWQQVYCTYGEFYLYTIKIYKSFVNDEVVEINLIYISISYAEIITKLVFVLKKRL